MLTIFKGLQLKHLVIFAFIVVSLFVLNNFFISNVNSNQPSKSIPLKVNESLDYFVTAKGKKHVNEIIENVFNKFGYKFIKNDLIPMLKKEVSQNCKEIFSEWQKIATNNLLSSKAPKEFSNPEEFLLNNYTAFKYLYSNDVPKNGEKELPVWNKKYIKKLISIVKKDPLGIPVTYFNESVSLYYATQYFSVKEKVGAVIGTIKPWAEAYVLANGAKNVTTIDYQKIKITHPQMNFLYAPDLPALQERYNGHFDFIVSYSSIEHSGLGRYGDPLDPIGDIREMNKIHCLLKKDGLLFFGVPVGGDYLAFNIHRKYGRMRLAMMFEGFKLLQVFYRYSKEPIELTQEMLENGFQQFLFVLQKID